MRLIITLLFALQISLSFAENKPYQGIDTNGNVLFTIEAEFVYPFNDGMACIKQLNLINNKWERGYGFINTKGEIVIPCKFEDARKFVDNRAWVKKEGEAHWTLINKKGEVIPTKKYEKVGYMIEGSTDLLAVYENGALGWINPDGEEVIPCKYLGSTTFDAEFGLACVTLYNGTVEKYGFINKQGEIEIPFQYVQSGTTSFKNGYCRANVGGKTVLIDSKGNVVFTPKFGSLQDFSHGLMAVATKPSRSGWGYCDMTNKMVVPGIYDNAKTINSDGYGILELNGKSGLVDPAGKIILPLEYSTVYAEPSLDGYVCGVKPVADARPLSKTPKDYFDAQLNPIDVGDVTLMSADGTSRIPFLTTDSKRGFMDREYNVVIPAKYSKATVFNDGIALVLP